MRMLRRETRRDRTAVAAVTAALGAAMALAGTALAAQQPVVAGDNAYSNQATATPYVMDQGEQLRFTNNGPSNEHDVWSRQAGPDGKKLFISPTIKPGNTTTVAGTQYLTMGS